MRKLLICLSLILVLTLVFVGCKDKAETPDGTTTEAPTTEAPTTDAPVVEDPTTEAPTTEDPTTEDPTTEAPTTEEPTDAPIEECTHSFPDEWTVDGSVEECAGEGRLYRECEACGEKETKADTCSFGEWTKVEGKECADEDRLVRVCSKCGKIEKAADGECTFGEPVVTEPECGKEGLSVVTCTKCGAIKEEKIDALEHVAAEGTEWHVTLAPTCTTAGYGFGECELCGEMVDVELAPLGHNANEPTCSAASVCATCGVTVAPNLPHTMVTVEAKDPTCTEVGYTAGEYCSVCGSIDALVVPATGHDYKWSVTTASTFTADGVNTGVCACGDTVTEAVAKRVPSVMYTAADLAAGTNVSYKDVVVTPNDGYVTLNPRAFGASVSFLLTEGQKFQDVISIKYRVSADFVSVSANKDAFFNVNGKAFYASLTGKNVVDYDNEGTVGEWTLLNINFRKSQVTIDGVEYDMFNGAALETIEYVLFNVYREGLSIDIEYVAFFDAVEEAEEYATNHGEVATPVVYAPTEKNYNTSLNNTNGAGEYGAPGIYLNEKNNAGATIVDWSGRFFANYNLTAVGTITVDGGVQKLMYSLDGGLTWLDFAEGNAVVNNGTYTVKFDLSAFEGQTVDIRVAAVLAVDGKTTEYASVLNLRKIKVVKGNLNDTIDFNYLAAAGNQQSNINATVQNGYVHYVVSGKSPTINLFKSETGIKVGQYMLIKYRGNGSGYGTNYDFYFDINGSGKEYNNVGGKKYAANWFNLTLDNTWNYIIVDLANGFGGKTFDMNNCTEINWILFDGAVTAAKGDWIDIAGVQFFDSYDAAKAVANPNGDYINITENGSTLEKFTFQGISADNIISGPGRVPAFTCDSTDPILLETVTLLSTDYQLNLAALLKAPYVAIPTANVGIQVGDYDIVWGSSLNDAGQHSFSYLLPADFVNGQEYTVKVLAKSAVNSEIILLDTFTLTRQPEGITIDKANATYSNDGSANISLAASAGALEDVVALWKGDTLVMYYGAYAGPTGFKANGGSNVTVADATLAKLTTEGTYTVKLHKGSVNGNVVASKEINLVNPGVVGNSVFTAAEVYTAWKNFGGAQWGFDATMSADGTYVRFTPNANNGDGGRIFLNFGQHFNTGWNVGACVGKTMAIKYRNHSSANQLNVCYDGCLAAGGNACGRGWIGTAANGWAMTCNDAWKMTGTTYMVLRFAPGITIDIESIVILDGWQGLGGAYDSVYGINWN